MPWRALLLSFFLLLLILLVLGPARAAGEESSPRLPAPKDVKVYSYNFHNTLRWSPVKVERGVVLYTVHFKTGAFNQWDEMNCTRIARTECSFPLSLNERLWTFVLRVRSELGQMTSDWVEADPFVAERDTTIGPPKVNSVIVSSDSLLISVSPPFESKEGTVQYKVSYWENATTATKEEMWVNNALFKIENLKQMTLYCFTIEIELVKYLHEQIPGLQRIPECYRTPMNETTRAVYIITTFTLVGLVLILMIIGLFFLSRHHKTIKHLCQPPLKIPSHIEEYLRDPSMPHLEVLENYPEEALPASLSVLYFEEGSKAYGDTLADDTRSHSSSGESEVTYAVPQREHLFPVAAEAPACEGCWAAPCRTDKEP